MFDHRLSHRAIPDRPLTVHDRHTGKQVGLLGNMSADGLLVLCEDDVGIGQMLELELRFPTPIRGKTTLAVDAESAWCAPVGQTGLMGLGLKLRHLSDDETEIVEQLIRDCVF